MAKSRVLPIILIAFQICLSSFGAQIAPILSFPAGETPSAGIVQGPNGNFYGVAVSGGLYGNGAIYEAGLSGLFTNLYSFNGTNGSAPQAHLLLGPDGSLYGTASRGGSANLGTVFKVTLAGVFTLIGNFTGPNGATPFAALVYTNGAFFGTTVGGGAAGDGTVFEISPNGGAFSNIASFGGANGSAPYAGLIIANGQMYGSTRYGGANGLGTIFSINTAGNLTNLFSFSGTNGAFPNQLIQTRNGNFYGTTLAGGPTGFGTVFVMSPVNNIRQINVFDLFHGSSPVGTLLAAADGLYYGITEQGGASGMGAIFTVSSNQSFATIASFSDFGYPPDGIIQGTDGNFYGVSMSGGANNSGVLFKLSGFYPLIISQPASRTGNEGSAVTFSVGVTGTPPFTYQWRFDGTNLTDGGNVSGSMSNFLTITGVTTNDAGSYSVLVGNDVIPIDGANGIASSNAGLKVIPDTVAPKITISTPTAGARTTNSVVSGTATDNAAVTAVYLWITNVNNGVATGMGPISASLAFTNPAAVSWMASPDLIPGTNLITAQSVDFTGNVSTKATRAFFYKVPAAFGLSINGSGKISSVALIQGGVPPTNGAFLNTGERYELVATPSPGWVFTNWSGSVASASSTLVFNMEPGYALQANFVANSFVGAAGTYNGLFFITNNVAEETCGMLSSLGVKTDGVYSGELWLAGVRYGISGKFDLAGRATNTILRASKVGGNVTLALQLNWLANPPQILGSVSGANVGGWTSPLVADLAINNLGSGSYTMLIEPGASGPPGYGYALISNHLGAVTFSGAMADGASFSETAQVSGSGDIPFYANLYNGGGLVLGWINLTNFGSSLTWIKKPSGATLLYTGGFTNVVSVAGSQWVTPPLHQAAITVTSGTLTVSGGGLAAPLALKVAVTTDNTLAKLSTPPTNALSGGIDPKTGLIKFSFGNGNGKSSLSAVGAVLQSTSSGGGCFLASTNAGAFLLQP